MLPFVPHLDKLVRDTELSIILVRQPMDQFFNLLLDPGGKHLVDHNHNDMIVVLRLDERETAKQN